MHNYVFLFVLSIEPHCVIISRKHLYVGIKVHQKTFNVNIVDIAMYYCIVSVTQHTTQLRRGISEMSCHVTFLLFGFVFGVSKNSC